MHVSHHYRYSSCGNFATVPAEDITTTGEMDNVDWRKEQRKKPDICKSDRDPRE
jgi:hypothetical protein